MDVDKRKIVVAKLSDDRDADVQERVIANTLSAVKKYFAPLAGQADVVPCQSFFPHPATADFRVSPAGSSGG
jgi:hypothetical protein